MAESKPLYQPLAIIGCHLRVPGADDIDQFWQNLALRKVLIEEIPDARWQDFPGKKSAGKYWGGFLTDIDRFDAEFFGIPDNDAHQLDPQLRLLLESVWHTLEDAGYGNHRRNPGSVIGLFAGSMWNHYALYSHEYGYLNNRYTGAGSLLWDMVNRISFIMNFTGPSIGINTACSSALAAVHTACRCLQQGDCDMAVAAGINLNLHPFQYIYLDKEKLLAREREKPCYAIGSEGYIPAEGVGSLLLKPLDRAKAEHDHIYGVITGSAVKHSGTGMYYKVPDSHSRYELIKKTLDNAGIGASGVQYFELSAFGSEIVDAAEFLGLQKNFRKRGANAKCCTLGTIKPNIGHLEAAAGIAQVVKVLFQLKYRKILPSIFAEKISGDIDLANSPFILQREMADWDTPASTPRRAGINSFGAGGTNACLIIEEYDNPAAVNRANHSASPGAITGIIPFSAKNPVSLERYLETFSRFLQDHDNITDSQLPDIAFTLQAGREAMEERLVFIITTLDDLKKKLAGYLENHQAAGAILRGTVNPLMEQGSYNMPVVILPGEIAEKWIAGYTIPWEEGYRNTRVQKVSLPGYIFTGKSYWLQREDNAQAALAPRVEKYLAELIAGKSTFPGITGTTLFRNLALDSVSIKELNAKLANDFGTLPQALFFEHADIRETADYLVNKHHAQVAAFFGQRAAGAGTARPLPLYQPAAIPAACDGIKAHSLNSEIAIIGVGGIYPQADNLEEFWENLKNGKDCITEIPAGRWDYRQYFNPDDKNPEQVYSKWGGFIRSVDQFDPLAFEIAPREAELMDPQERLFLMICRQTLDDAGYLPHSEKQSQHRISAGTGVFAGVMWGEYQFYGVEETLRGNPAFAASLFWSIPNRVSFQFDFHAPSIAVDTACSSSLAALHLACESIRRGECEQALAGGVSLSLHPAKYIYLCQKQFAAHDGRCRSFGAGGSGYVPGEGAGAVLLKPLHRALADRDHIYAVIKATGLQHGGKTNGYTVPSPLSQMKLIASTLEHAGLHARTISYVEAHGAGTALGDPVEIEGLTRVFREQTADRQFCAIGSVKSNIGHTEAAAGIAGLTKVLLQFKHKTLVPSLHAQKLNPGIDFENSPFFVQQTCAEWKQPVVNEPGEKHIYPRRAAISSFGAGGMGAHVILEEYEPPVNRAPAPGPYIFVLSAGNDLPGYTKRILEYLKTNLEATREKTTLLDDILFTLQVSRSCFAHRIACVFREIDDLIGKLEFYMLHNQECDNLFLNTLEDEERSFSRLPAEELCSLPVWERYVLIARSWTKGRCYDWPLPDARHKAYRVSLPPAPFVNRRYWFPGKQKAAAAPLPPFHPLLDSNLSTLYDQKYTKTFFPHDILVKGHNINRQHVLPAVISLLSAQAAAASSTGQAIDVLSDITFTRAVLLADNPVPVEIKITPSGGTAVHFELTVKEQECLFCNGWGCSRSTPAADTAQIPDAKEPLPYTATGVEFYRNLKQRGMEYTDFFQCLDKISYNTNYAVAELHVAPGCPEFPAEYCFHPFLLDAALHSTLIFTGDLPSAAFVPQSIDNITLYNRPGNRITACLTLKAKNAETGALVLDVMLYNGDNGIAVAVTGLHLQRIKALPAVQPEIADAPAMGFYSFRWLPSPPVTTDQTGIPEYLNGQILIFDGNTPLPVFIREYLATANGSRENPVNIKAGNEFTGENCREYLIRKDESADYAALFSGLLEKTEKSLYILFLWPLADHAFAADELILQPASGLLPLFLLTRELINAGIKQTRQRNVHLLFVYREQNPAEPHFAALGGFIKTLHLENPRFRYKIIKIDKEEAALAPLLLGEWTTSCTYADEIAYSGGVRYINQMQALPLPGQGQPGMKFRDNGVYLVTGGAGSLGLIFIRYLSKLVKAVFVLCGRSELPEKIKAEIASWQESGSRIDYIQADISKETAVIRLYEQIRKRYMQLNGVIHCAGQIQDAFIARITSGEMDAVLAPKIAGACLLDKIFREEPLDFFILFSSLAGVLGNPGQAVYGYANSFLDHFAVFRNQLYAQGKRQGLTTAIAWPLWENGGMEMPQAAREFLEVRLGMLQLSTNDGIDAFTRILTGGCEFILPVYGFQERILHCINRQGLNPEAEEYEKQPQPAGKSIDAGTLKLQAINWLKEIFSQVLKVPAGELDADKGYERYGIDSVTVLLLNNSLDRECGALSKTLLYEYRTLSGLADYFIANHHKMLQEKFIIPEGHKPGVDILPTAGKTFRQVHPGQGLEKKKRLSTGYAPVAVIGLAGRYPASENLQEFWENLKAAKDFITGIPAERWNYQTMFAPDKDSKGTIYTKWGSFLDDIDKFDPLFFQITPREAVVMDPQERIFLQIAWHTLEDAGYTRALLAGEKTGVFAGAMWNEYQQFASHTLFREHNIVPRASFASLANRVSYTLNLSGPSLTVDTMCSSSLTALHLACRSLHNGECTYALAGGVNLSLSPYKYFRLSEGKFASTDGRCRSFGRDGNGYVPGEGAGAVLLKPLEQAMADHDHIYAVLTGSSINHGGHTNGYTIPNPQGQAACIGAAIGQAGIDPATITCLEAHGTGTALGDPIEISGLVQAFGKHTGRKQFCSIGAVKSNLGHLEAAAGIAGLTKLLLQLQFRTLVPSLHAEKLNPLIDFTVTPFYVQQTLQEWVKDKDTVPYRAGLSAFGAGGANAHIIIEEYLSDRAASRASLLPAAAQINVFLLSAANKKQLERYAARFLDFFSGDNPGAGRLQDILYTLQTGREALTERLAIIAADLTALRTGLKAYTGGETLPGNMFTGTADDRLLRDLFAGNPGVIFLQEIIKEKNWPQLAALWVKGAAIDWNFCYPGQKPYKTALPLYPFSKESYWIPRCTEPAADTRQEKKFTALHPLVDSNISTLAIQQFTKKFYGDEYYFTEHLIQDEPLLPAAACIAMMTAGAALSLGKEISRENGFIIEDCTFIKPLSCNTKPLQTQIAIIPAARDGIQAEIKAAENSRLIYSRCYIKAAPGNADQTRKTIDLEAVRQRCRSRETAASCYSLFASRHYTYGRSFRVIQSVVYNPGEALAELVLPPHLENELPDFFLHPVLLDGALHSIMLFLPFSGNGIFMPFSIRKIEFLHAPAKMLYCHYRLPGAGADPFTYDLDLYNQQLELTVRIYGFTVKSVAGITKKQAGDAQSAFYIERWQPGTFPACLKEQPVSDDICLLADSETITACTAHNRFSGSLHIVPLKEQADNFCYTAGGNVMELATDSAFIRLRELVFADRSLPGKYLIGLTSPLAGQAENPASAPDAYESCINKSILFLFRIINFFAGLRQDESRDFLIFYTTQDPYQAIFYTALRGFIKTLQAEFPLSKFKIVEYDHKADTSTGSLQAFFGNCLDEWHHFNARAIRYAGGERWINDWQPVSLNPEAQAPDGIREGGTYLVTGGSSGLGLIFARYLLENYHAKVIITGRSASAKDLFIQEKKWEGRLVYRQSDAGKPGDVEALIRFIKAQYREINGIIHSAGITRDALMTNKDTGQFREVLKPKLDGIILLDYFTRQEPLDFFAVFSSLSALAGNPGQTDYAYANCFVNHFIEYREALCRRKERQGRSRAILWPLWAEGGMGRDPETRLNLAMRFGIKPLETNHGIALFMQILQANHPVVAVVSGNPARFEQALAASGAAFTVPDEEGTAAGSSAANDGSGLQAVVTAYIKQLFADVTGLPAAEIVETAAFERYGIDSVMITELNLRLSRDFPGISSTLFYEFHTIGQLADYFYKHRKAHWTAYFTNTLKPDDPAAQEREDTNTGTAVRFLPQYSVPTVQSACREEVAIIGLAGKYPQADNLEQFWENLENSRDCIVEIPEERWDYRTYYDPEKGKPGKIYSKWCGVINDVYSFDPLFFGISPLEAESLDPQERLFLETAWNTIEDAGYTRTALKKERVGVFAGVMYSDYLLYGTEQQVIAGGRLQQSSFSQVANRVSYCCDFHGPSIAFDTMCASALTAIYNAVRCIQNGEIGYALAGAVNLALHPNKYLRLCKSRFLSSDGRCRSFGQGGDGYVPGEGVGAVLLKPLSRASADHDHVYGVIKSINVNHGGKVNGFTVPNPAAQAELIRITIEQAGIDPETITCIEAHGTGTMLGDPVEITGLSSAFRQFTSRKQFCALGSVKSNIGHLEAAAGMAGLTKLLLQLKHRQLVPSLHAAPVNPAISFGATPFYVQTGLTAWEALPGQNGQTIPRRAGLSAFGAGGSNAHLILEEYTQLPDNRCSTDNAAYLIILSAAAGAHLGLQVKKLISWLTGNSTVHPADLAYTLQTGREAMQERIAMIVSTLAELITCLKRYLEAPVSGSNLFVKTGNPGAETANAVAPGASMKANTLSLSGKDDLKILAAMWINGISIDWSALYPGEHPYRISLPTCSFDKAIYRIPVAPVTARAAGKRDHPLFSRYTTTTPAADRKIFTVELDPDLPVIRGHRIAGAPVVPAAVLLEVLLTAYRVLFDDQPHVLEQIVFYRPPAGAGAVLLSIDFTGEMDNCHFEIFANEHCKTVSGFINNKTVHDSRVPGQYNINDLAGQCGKQTDKNVFYAAFAQAGIEYAPYLQCITSIRTGENSALCYIELPGSRQHETERFALHPVLLDNALHSSAVLLQNDSPRVPFTIDRIILTGSLKPGMYCYIRNMGSSAADIALLDDEGRLLVGIEKLFLKEWKSPGKDQGVSCADLPSPFFKPVWQETKAGHPVALVPGMKILFIRSGDDDKMAQALSRQMPEQQCFFLDIAGLPEDTPGAGLYSPFNASSPTAAPAGEQQPFPYDMLIFTANPVPGDPAEYTADMLPGFTIKQISLLFGLVKETAVHIPLDRSFTFNIITYNTFSPGSEPACTPYLAGLAGLVKSAKAEFPALGFYLFDIDAADDIPGNTAPTIMQLLGTDHEPVSCIRQDKIYRQTILSYLPETSPRTVFREKGVYWITGGLGGIGYALATYLVKTCQAAVLLTGRSACSAGQEAKIRELNRMGGKAVYLQADVTDRPAMEKAIARAEQSLGKINGVFHTAAVLRDRTIPAMSRSDLESVLAPKVTGSIVLAACLKGKALDFLCFFSSAQSFTCDAGQANYAAGSAFIDAYALYLAAHLPYAVKVINWGYWGSVGMARHISYNKLMTKRGIASIEPEEGMAAIETLLKDHEKQLIYFKATGTTTDTICKILGKPVLPGINAHTFFKRQDAVKTDNGRSMAASNKQAADKSRWENAVGSYLKRVFRETINIPGHKLNLHRTFDHYGIDSIIVLEITRRIGRDFPGISVALLFENNTLQKLQDYLLTHHAGEVSSLFALPAVPENSITAYKSPAGSPGKGAGAAIARLEHLSDDDIDKLYF